VLYTEDPNCDKGGIPPYRGDYGSSIRQLAPTLTLLYSKDSHV
jgi:hypothetical protein